MPKAYSYLRFSRPEQALGDSYRRQIEKARKYAAENDLDLDETLTFHDEGISAYQGLHLEVGRLGDFLQEVRAGRVEKGSYLLVESLDRLSRQHARKAQRVLEDICDEGIIVVTLIDGRRYDHASLESDPLAMIMSLLTFFRAHEESATKATRLKEAWINKRNLIGTKPLTAKAPHWLHLDKQAGAFDVVEDRAALVRRVFDMYLSGIGPGAIAKTLNAEGVSVWGRGVMWHRSYVTKILCNPAVYGVYTPHTLEHLGGRKRRVPLEPIAGYFPAVVSEETFLEANDVKKTKGVKGRKAAIKLNNIFSRLGRCPVCGSPMLRVNKARTFQYLACSAAKNGAKVCRYRSVPYDKLESSFLAAIRVGLPIPTDDQKLSELEALVTEHEARIAKAIGERANLIEAIKAGTLRNDHVYIDAVPVRGPGVVVGGNEVLYQEKNVPFTLRDEIELLDQTVDANRKSVSQLKGQINLLRPAAVVAKVQELEDAIRSKELDRERINAALRSICTSAVIRYDEGVIELRFKHTDKTVTVPAETRAVCIIPK